ncbi:MAG: EamA family transporter [Proteobacteria bacterium]|nr:EamA family transporter [Pseudomonadota bacterium]
MRAILSPYFQLGISAILISAAEVFMKTGATADLGEIDAVAVINFAALSSIATWIGVVFYVLSFVIWLHVLRHMPLTQAYALSSIVHILVPVSAWLFLHETISIRRGMGILLVLIGTLLVAASSANAEEKL